MNQLLESTVSTGFVFDSVGVIGLGILALAAMRLVKNDKSWGGSMLGYGALALLVARLYVLVSPQFVTLEFHEAIGPIGIALTEALPPLFLTFGLAGVVWGLWGHERWMKEKC